MKDKFLSIQVLRAYACFFVIISHLVFGFHSVIKQSNVYIDLCVELLHGFDIGALGVIQFFFISGFVITMVAMRENRFEFIIKRFFRLFPPILFSLIVIAMLYNVLHYTNMTKVLEGGGYMHME